MPANLHLNGPLLATVVKLGKFKTKTQAVNAALEEYVRNHNQSSLIELFGTIDYDENFDYKKLRARRKGRTLTPPPFTIPELFPRF